MNALKTKFILLQAAIAVSLLSAVVAVRAAESTEEQQQITVLQSDNSPQQKDAACVRLKRIGTASSVPALAALLADEQLSHSARYALESMAAPEAGRALTDALAKTRGPTRVGIINSLGNRRETQAVPDLAAVLGNGDADERAACATALGKIGGAEAGKALASALSASNEKLRAAVADGVLACANRRLDDGDPAAASALFRQLHEAKTTDAIRMAAFNGLIRAAGDGALALVISGISGSDAADQAAAIQAARGLQDPAATATLAALLSKSSQPVQIALVGVLSQRGDPAAAAVFLELAKSPDAAVRVPAIAALGSIADASAVPLLAKASVATDPAEQTAARQSLIDLHRGNVTDALIKEMISANPAVQSELARALGLRADKAAVPRLLDLAGSDADVPRKAGLRALAMVADSSQMDALVKLVVNAQDAGRRAEAAEVMGSVCERLQQRQATAPQALLDGIKTAHSEARVALLPACSVFVGENVRATLRAALADNDPAVRAAATRAICDTRDPDMIPDILALAHSASDASLRLLPIRGYVRLATDPDNKNLTPQQRADLLKPVLPLATRVEEKRVVLAGLATLPDPAALSLTLPFLDDSSVRAEAVQAATQIAGAIHITQPEPALAALKRVVTVATTEPQRQTAGALIQEIETLADYITGWQVAGPYVRDGKAGAELFEVAFPPEIADARDVQWRTLPGKTDPQKPWLMDLLKFLGGNERVAYTRTRIYSEKAQPARLDLGSDDGAKAWLNGKPIHTNNAVRGLTRDSDKVNVTLQAGWNTLQLKITQAVAGWEFCARLVQPDGSRLEGLKFEATFANPEPAQSR